jgi:hypothetical protein
VSFADRVGDLHLIVKHCGKMSYVSVTVDCFCCIGVYAALLRHQLRFLLLGSLLCPTVAYFKLGSKLVLRGGWKSPLEDVRGRVRWWLEGTKLASYVQAR